LARFVPWLAWTALSARVFARTARLAVDLPFWDQWDYLTGFIDGASPAQLFDWQVGMHRLGLAAPILEALLAATRWDLRAEAFAAAGAAALAAALALVAVRRAAGSASAWDALVPLALLTGLHADAAAGAGNLAPGPLPQALLFAAALARRPGQRYGALLAIDLLAIFTGFALVIAPAVRALLLLDLCTARRAGEPRGPAAVALALSAIAPLLFLQGYAWAPGTSCVRFPPGRPAEVAAFFALLQARPFGISGAHGWRAPFLWVAAAAALGIAWASLRRLLRAPRDPAGRAAVLLCAWSLGFAALATLGRVCLGVEAAAAPRYVPFTLALWVAAVLLVRARPLPERPGADGPARPEAGRPPAAEPMPDPLRTPLPDGRSLLLTALLCAFAAKEALVSLRPVRETLELSDGKRRARACLIELRDRAACEQRTGFAIHPAPGPSRVDQKLRWLERRRLSLFR
jgi:hypothetical protein